MAVKALKMAETRHDPNQTLMEDRISQLPDSVLLHILSFVPTFDAYYRAGFVSKRWSSLRNSIPSLIFQSRDVKCPFHVDGDDITRFISIVNELLIFHDPHNLERCCFDLHYSFISSRTRTLHLDAWLRLVVKLKVKELEVLVKDSSNHYYNKCRSTYFLPISFFNYNGVMTKLSLEYVGFKNCTQNIHWKSLKSLSMKYIYLDDTMLGKLLTGCPILVFLELNNCRGINKLDVASQTLQKLIIHNCVYSSQRGELLRISVPSLRVLVISVSNRYYKTSLENLVSLVEATLHFEIEKSEDSWDSESEDSTSEDSESEDTESEDNGGGIHFLIRSVQHVQKLTLSGTWNNVHAQSTQLGPCAFSNCKTLTLDISLEQWELHGLAIMLYSCPELENLTINMKIPQSNQLKHDNNHNGDGGKNFWVSDPSYMNFNCLLVHLKKVKIVGLLPCHGGQLVVEFFKFLLKHARVLESLSIRTDEKPELKDVVTVFQLSVLHMLLSFPRSSVTAVIEVTSRL